MTQIRIEELEESFVIYLGGESNTVNAYTLASTLISFADAARVANDYINPGYNIEIQVIALGSGSFKTKIKAKYEEAKNLFTKEDLKTIVLSVIAAFLFQYTLAPDLEVNIIVNDDSVIIKQEGREIIVPREVHEKVKEVEQSEDFNKKIGNTFTTIENDSSISSFGIQKDMDTTKPPIEIPREIFPQLSALVKEEPDSEERYVTQIEKIKILRAILEKSTRMWQFSWKGIRISAPVLDERFYQKFYNHDITIAPGDALKVKLKIHQKRNDVAGIYVNKKYEVIEVLDYTSRSEQIDISESSNPE